MILISLTADMQLPEPKLNVALQQPAEPGASIGVFLALLAGTAVFSYSSTALMRYPDHAIGIGLMNGVDPGRRFPIYLTIVATTLGVWLACHYSSRLLRRLRPSWFVGARARLENDLCASFAAVGSVAILTRVSADRLDGLTPTLLCLAGCGFTGAFALIRRLSRRLTGWTSRLGSLNSLAVLALLAWPGARVSGVIGNVRLGERAWLGPLGTLLLPLAFALALGLSLRRPNRCSHRDVERAFIVGGAPLFLFPSLCPVANEVQLALAQRGVSEPRYVALAFLTLLVGLGAVLFWRARSGQLRWAPTRVLARGIYPSIIFGEALLSVYHHTLNIKRVDPLHDGEQITAVHQLLSFDKWPFVDIWPAHGLYDYIGALYAAVNGFRPMEITAWNGLLSALSATAVYAVLANIASPLLAFLVAALLPIEAILPLPMYSFFYAEPGLLAVGMLACIVIAKPTLARQVLLSLSAFLCFFWTPTSGVAAIAAVLGLLMLGLLTSRQRKPLWRGLAVFVATSVGVFVAYVLVLFSCGRPVLETLQLVRAFMQADPLIGGRPSVLEHFDSTAFLQYVLLPGIGLIYLSRLARHAIERQPMSSVDRLLGFLTLVSFVLFARTLTRHGITERYQPFFFVLLALCAWMPPRIGATRCWFAAVCGRSDRSEAISGVLARHFSSRAGARAWFCAALALYLVWSPQPSYKQLDFSAFDFRTWQAKESRFQGDAPTYSKLKAFLDSVLGPKDTFLELLNMPVLYGLLDREVPGQFFLPTMFYATDSVQKSYLQRLDAFGGAARVPVVLLPEEKGRNIDKIDNAFRSYRIAERVYRDYLPLGTLDGFEVWVSRSRWDDAARKSVPVPLSFLDPARFRTVGVDPPSLVSGVLRVRATGTDPRVEDIADVDGIHLGRIDSHHAVRLSYRTSVAGKLELFYRFEGGRYNAADSGRATLTPSTVGEWQTVEVPVPPGAGYRSLTGLRIDPPDGAELEIKELAFVFGQPPAALPEAYSAGMLPFFWANFDDQRVAERARVLQRIDVPRDSPPRPSFVLNVSAIEDRASGTYLKLCIRLPGVTTSATRTRWQSIQHAGSWQSAGKITLTYGSAPAATFAFDLVQPTPGVLGLPRELVRSFGDECKPYLVRLSAQYAWSSQTVSSISLASSVPIMLESAGVLAGD